MPMPITMNGRTSSLGRVSTRKRATRTSLTARMASPTTSSVLPPMRSERMPASGEATRSETAKGSMSVPVWMGSMPSTDWQNRGIRNIAPHEGEVQDDAGHHPHGVVAVPEQRQVHQGLAAARAFVEDERDCESRGGRERKRHQAQPERMDGNPRDDQLARAHPPAVARSLDEAPRQQKHGEGRQDDSRHVQPVLRPCVLRLGHHGESQGEADRPERNVHEEHVPPVVRHAEEPVQHGAEACLRQPAADDRPHDEGEARDGAPEAHGPAALFLREVRRDERQRGRHHSRPPDALDDAEGDQLPDILRCPAERRAGRETDQAGEEHRPAADHVAEPAQGDEEHGEGEQVGVADPLHLGQGGAELPDDGRHREIDDVPVEVDHEQGEADRAEHEPSGAARTSLHVRSSRCPFGVFNTNDGPVAALPRRPKIRAATPSKSAPAAFLNGPRRIG